ncbi:hypothetical protein FACS189499_09120 [Clostridia bacterium]|nr:hypothetical protein FACS189499_09120 [Clostridia bacterium]
MLKTIQQVSGYVREHETEFVTKLRVDSEIQQNAQAKSQKKQLVNDKRRVTELDKLIQQIYEDKVTGTLTEKRFSALSKQYESEQETLERRITESEKELAQFADDSNRADKFIELVRKYTDFEELTPQMLNEYISKIVVHEAERPRGERNQRVDIYLIYIGQFAPSGCEQTFPEYQSLEDKRKEYQREYYQKNKDKILNNCAERYAAKKSAQPAKPTKSAEEIEAEQAARKAKHREYQRNYQREWRNKRKSTSKSTQTAAT